MYYDGRYPSNPAIVWNPISNKHLYGFDCAQLLLKREMQAFQLDSILLSIDAIIISDEFNKNVLAIVR